MITSLAEAIKANVKDGDTVALEGFTHLIPFAAGHEIIRQGRRDLTLVRMTPDVLYDQLIGMGVARKLIFSWGATPASGLSIGFGTPLNTTGPSPLNWKSTVTPVWPIATSLGPVACPLPFSAAIREPTYLRIPRTLRASPAPLLAKC